MKYNPKTTAIPKIIPVVLICTAGIISASRMHLYLAFLFHRDYFAPSGFISISRFCPTGIILPRPDSSLSRAFAPQGLFPPAGCISIFLFCSTGIISTGQMHLYLPLLLHRDYFRQPNASLSRSFAPQGLFPPAKCISIFLFCSTGIILPQLDASLSCSFAPQGLFPPVGFIPSLLFCSTGIMSAGQMHLYLALLLHRDYFRRSNASLPSSFVPQGLFPPARCISISLFCSTGIISTGQMHLYLALLFHRDYFHRPNASLSCSFVTQGLLPPVECISNLGSCKVSATKLLLYRKHSYGFC